VLDLGILRRYADFSATEESNISMAIQRLLHFKASRLCFLTRTVARYTSGCHSDINQEEDSSTSYDANKYYPACIGELIHDKYCLVSKLGWGGNSTVWLAKDSSR
jgi:hypothetical protein